MTPYITQRLRAWRLSEPVDLTRLVLVISTGAIAGIVYALALTAVYAVVTWSLPDPWAVARLAIVLGGIAGYALWSEGE